MERCFFFFFLTVLTADALVSVKLDRTFDLCHVSVNPITVKCL